MGKCPLTCEQICACGDRWEGAAVGSVKNNAHLSKLVQVGGFNFLVAVTTQMVAAEGIGNEDDDVERTVISLHKNRPLFTCAFSLA